MTANFGTDTGYSVLAGDFYSLALDCSDKIWGTNINYCDLVQTMKITDGMENDPQVLDSYVKLRDGCYNSLVQRTNNYMNNYDDETYTMAKDNVTSEHYKTNIFQLLKRIPEASIFTDLCEKTGWSGRLMRSGERDKMTVFVPTNRAFREAASTWLSIQDPKMIRELLKAHTADYALEWKSMIGRLLEIYTYKEGFSFISDGTGRFKEKSTFIKNLTFNLI